jgi:hypothetical protein
MDSLRKFRCISELLGVTKESIYLNFADLILTRIYSIIYRIALKYTYTNSQSSQTPVFTILCKVKANLKWKSSP